MITEQRALSITSDWLLMLFNDGLGTYSTVSAYSIDQASMTATEVWDYDAGQTIYSPFCPGTYGAADQSTLVD